MHALSRVVCVAAAIVVAGGASRAVAQSPARPDLARTIDAEVRVATFEMVSGSSLAALSRLERLSDLVGRDSSGVAAAEKAGLHFLLAESYYRLGMLGQFRREAEAALATGQLRYASVLRPQLVIEAYRAGDYQRAATLARDLPAADAGLGALVAGLAAYKTGDMPTARAAFQRAAGAGGELGGYAKYMDAIAQLRADTTQAAAAVATLESVAGAAVGPFADQARVTAAQVAYEGERYDDAVRIAAMVADGSPVAAPALLTRGWALYKLERVDEAERAFTDFVTRFPNRPERDEAQLMAAQAQLELGRSTDAERVFQRIADSASVQASSLLAQTNAAIGDVARALVANRAAELLLVDDPVGVKAIMVSDSSGAEVAFAAVGGATDATSGIAARPAIVTASAGQRLDSLASRNPTVTRVLFAPSASPDSRALAASAQSLASVDAAVAVARFRLADQVDAQQREIALLTRLAATLSVDSAGVAALAAQHRVLADSVARLDQLMAAAEARLRQALQREMEATRSLAAENQRTADSLRTALAAGAGPEDRAAIEAEVATAAAYGRIVEMVTTGLDKAIAHHPAFVARDSLRAHSARSLATLTELQSSYAGSRRGIDDALAALRSGDAPATRAARQALADAEARRAASEAQVIAAVSAELNARATLLAQGLQHNAEAAQFGTASAAFFRAIDGTRALGGGTTDRDRKVAPQQQR
jgi:tetratricopeptide (TPR) repeat protein